VISVATFPHDQTDNQARGSLGRKRWFIGGVIAVAIIVAIVLIALYSGGGSGGAGY
jgi:hypothetical protein